MTCQSFPLTVHSEITCQSFPLTVHSEITCQSFPLTVHSEITCQRFPLTVHSEKKLSRILKTMSFRGHQCTWYASEDHFLKTLLLAHILFHTSFNRGSICCTLRLLPTMGGFNIKINAETFGPHSLRENWNNILCGILDGRYMSR